MLVHWIHSFNENIMISIKQSSKFASALSALLLSSQALACATCGCSLSSDGALGYSAAGGWGISLDDSFVNQSQLRKGTGAVSREQAQAVPGQEVENQTINRYLTVGISYVASPDWNFKLSLPYIDRTHTTYGTTSTLPLTSDQLSGATATGLGDIKFVASYQGLLANKSLGIQAGFKLPTGNYGGAGANNDSGEIGQGSVGRNPVGFGPGGNTGSSYLDTSLNVGNGSTDLILGAYYFQAISQDFDAFVNGQYQFSVRQQLNQTGADFKPGDATNISLGLRYEANPQLVPQLQINLTHKAADSGKLADTDNTAGTALYLSPGVSASVLNNTQVYAFLQVPIYSNLSGFQLFPRYTVSVGMNYHF
ncbi:hypothetical protein AAKU67_001551 [Oxalobacteraceae bacterium GrIS 2.11]